MSDRKLGFVWWRSAKTDPPGHPGDFPTDVGIAWHSDISGQWFDRNAAFGSPALEHQPRWWCDPSPPGDDAPTAEDLRRVLRDAQTAYGGDSAEAARFRRAIEETER